MRVHLIDGTYELFRQHFGMARLGTATAIRTRRRPAWSRSTLALVQDGATHVAVASDHVIESFRNDLWPGYKTSDGMDPEILAQIPVVERALEAAGFVVWPMVEHEADDALGGGRRDRRRRRTGRTGADRHRRQGPRPVRGRPPGGAVRPSQARMIIDADGVREKFGVGPESIADYLGLVGDTADGFPGLAGLGGQERGARARPVRAPREHSAVGRPVGRRRPARRAEAVGDAAGEHGRGAAVPPDRHRRDRPRRRHGRFVAWTGPTDDFADVAAEEIGAPDLVALRRPPRADLNARPTFVPDPAPNERRRSRRLR